jgi:lipopolysaccharide/colanic/teichoic acid biosynthesis glycosyltransferase
MQSRVERLGHASKRFFDMLAAVVLLTVFAPLIVAVAVAIKLDSRGPVFFRARRVGFRGGELQMLKFRKMRHDAQGPALTSTDDDRLTRIGRWLTHSKVDEIPQLWNVLRGQMSLVGPRPEHPGFVEQRAAEYEKILSVRPGITGLSQLAFAREAEILDPEDRLNDYMLRIFPQKIALDQLYADCRSLLTDGRILAWTVAAVLFRREVAVDRTKGTLRLRRRPVVVEPLTVDMSQAEVEV